MINANYVSRLLIAWQDAIICKAMNFASIKRQHKCNQPSVSCLKPNKADRILLNTRLVYNTVFMVNIAEGLLGEPFPFTWKHLFKYIFLCYCCLVFSHWMLWIWSLKLNLFLMDSLLFLSAVCIVFSCSDLVTVQTCIFCIIYRSALSINFVFS